ncbi:MAG: ceramidase domain-containing protein, partial [Acidobacteriota bacterium]|nr:ceramidase domain-containing protein [Acidobacteriota bacterium]
HGLTPVSMLYAGATTYLGAGSLLMHGTHTAWGAWADNVGMVGYILVPWLVNVAEMGRWSVRRLLGVYAVLLVVYATGYALWGDKLGISLDLFELSIALWGISELLYRFWSPLVRALSGLLGFAIAAAFGIMPWEMLAEPAKFWWVILFWLPAALSHEAPRGRRTYPPWYFAGVALYMIAFAIWLTGRPGNPWCHADSLIQAHAIWHLMSAVAILCFFKFLRTER